MNLRELSDDALFGKVEALAETERFSLIDFLIHLGELDERDACERKGYSSVFAYLTRRLGYSECDAMRRVRTARAAKKYPSILPMLARGDLHLASVSMLAPYLTSENHQRLLRKAARRSTREVERMAAELAPPAPGPCDRMRALPAPAAPPAPERAAPDLDGLSPLPGLEAAFPTEPAAPQNPPERRVAFSFTAGEEVRGLFEEARDLLRHRFPAGRMEEIIGEALRRLVETERPGRLHGRRWAAPAGARLIPKWVEDEVWRRDGGRCAFVSQDGLRCGETAWLELDHIIPWSLGGRSDDPANVRLLCRAHNQSEARRILGDPTTLRDPAA